MPTPAPAPAPSPAPVPAPKHGPVQWLEVHVLPGLREALADAEKARAILPKVEAYLPKLTAAAAADPAIAEKLGPLVAEAGEILAFITSL